MEEIIKTGSEKIIPNTKGDFIEIIKTVYAFINGSFKNMKNGVLSGKQMFFSICSEEVKQKGKRDFVILILEKTENAVKRIYRYTGSTNG